MKIEAEAGAARVTHYSIFDRTAADIGDPDLVGDLNHLAASLDYLDYLASAQQAAPKPDGRHTPYSVCRWVRSRVRSYAVERAARGPRPARSLENK